MSTLATRGVERTVTNRLIGLAVAFLSAAIIWATAIFLLIWWF